MSNKSIRGNADWYLKLFNQFEKGMNGESKQPVHLLRKQAIQQFSELGFPTTRDEEWKYTDIRPLTKINFERAPEIKVSKSDINALLPKGQNTHVVIFIDGIFQPDLSVGAGRDKGLLIQSLRHYRTEHAEDVARYFARYSAEDSNTFTALNTAFTDDGAVVIADRNAVIENPVHILYLSSANSGQSLALPRNLIIAEANAQLKVVEIYASLGEALHFTNAVSEIVVKENASVEHFKIQQENMAAYHISSAYIYQQRDSRFKSHNFVFGGKLVRNNIKTVLDAQGIECTLNGLYVGIGDQHLDNHTSIDHAMPNCHSDELYKGILDDHAHGVFHGKILVRPDAQKTNAIQSNNSILLSDNASIDTKPQLEIFADDVRCTHGATIGQLDEDAYFYLRSRGLDKKRARQLLIYAFASDVIDRVEMETVREHLAELLAAKLHTIRPK